MKHKMSSKETFNLCKTDEDACKLTGAVTCDEPNDQIYTFNGVFNLQYNNKISLTYEQFLLRGSSLRNTDWIYGVVTYPGHDTKIMRNSVGARSKHSRVEQLTNLNIILIFAL